MTAMILLDIHVSDAYFIVAHIHLLLLLSARWSSPSSPASITGFPKMTGRMTSDSADPLP